jgi:hypothetical protein
MKLILLASQLIFLVIEMVYGKPRPKNLLNSGRVNRLFQFRAHARFVKDFFNCPIIPIKKY